jgi:hypothetical protein
MACLISEYDVSFFENSNGIFGTYKPGSLDSKQRHSKNYRIISHRLPNQRKGAATAMKINSFCAVAVLWEKLVGNT